MKKTILLLVGIGLLVVWSVMAQTNPCIWNPWTVATAPAISVTVNSPGNQCIGTQVSVTATAATTDGTKTRTDNCGNSQTNTLALSTPTWTWSLSGVTANVTSGTTNTAIFTPNSAGTATVTFIAIATTTDPAGTYSATNSVTFTVVAVDSLTANLGTLWTTGTYLVRHGSGTLTVTAASNPITAEAYLPSCWTLSGGTGNGKLQRTVDTTNPGKTVITATSGASTRTITIIVYVAEVRMFADGGTTGFCDVGHSWWELYLSPDAKAVLSLGDQYFIDTGGFWPNNWQPSLIYPTSGPGLVAIGPQGHTPTGSHAWDTTIDHIVQGISYLRNWQADPGIFDLYNRNCTTEGIRFGNTVYGFNIPTSIWKPSDFSTYLQNLK